MTPGRKLIYGFMNLPHYKKLELMRELYTDEEARNTEDVDLFVLCFRRAKEQNTIENLKTRIEKAKSG